ncbi:helix-turn-helix domain-containing protein [Streptomyces sp. NPDC002520]
MGLVDPLRPAGCGRRTRPRATSSAGNGFSWLARTRLSGPGWAGQSIAEIAHACGFGSHASFSTAFRQEFGMTPREARHRALPPPADRAPGGVK